VKRAPFVLAATAAGLAGILAFRTSPSSVSLGLVPGAPARSAVEGHGSVGQSLRKLHLPPGKSRTVVGPPVNYNYGTLSVRITITGHRIVKVAIASLVDGGMYRSKLIDHQAIPILESQALRTQGDNIQGVSGASYTSSGFVQSLQGALHKLGVR
jgi:uncharacterized protein with FMN-binding domain